MSDFVTNYSHYSKAVARANALNKQVVFDALLSAGITGVLVEFDGCGDSGQIESVTARAGETSVEIPHVTLGLQKASWGGTELTVTQTPLKNAVEELCYGCLEQTHAGWENNDGAYGEFTFDIAARTITLDFNGRFTDTWSDTTQF